MNRKQREHIYRAKRLDTGEWVEGFYVCYRGSIHQIYSNNVKTKRGDIGAMFFDIDPETLCEYQGSTLKGFGADPSRIFENHILKVSFNAPKEEDKIKYFHVEFHHGMFLARLLSTGKVIGPVSNLAASKYGAENARIKCEIIGNSFDDTELLEKLRP